MLQGSFKGISRKIKEYFNEVLSGVQGCLKVVKWVFEGVSKVFREIKTVVLNTINPMNWMDFSFFTHRYFVKNL